MTHFESPKIKIESSEKYFKILLEENKRMEKALISIAKWHGEFPDTKVPAGLGRTMSYAAAYGSNGEIDFMRKKAQEALPINQLNSTVDSNSI